jgi:hypothetical protein
MRGQELRVAAVLPGGITFAGDGFAIFRALITSVRTEIKQDIPYPA